RLESRKVVHIEKLRDVDFEGDPFVIDKLFLLKQRIFGGVLARVFRRPLVGVEMEKSQDRETLESAVLIDNPIADSLQHIAARAAQPDQQRRANLCGIGVRRRRYGSDISITHRISFQSSS